MRFLYVINLICLITDVSYYPVPNKRTGTFWKKLLRLRGGFAWVWSKKPSEILVGTFIWRGYDFSISIAPWGGMTSESYVYPFEAKVWSFFNEIHYSLWKVSYPGRQGVRYWANLTCQESTKTQRSQSRGKKRIYLKLRCLARDWYYLQL